MTTLTLTDGRAVAAATGGKDIGTDGPLAVLVHGAGMDRTVWALQTRWLAHHGCPALAIDLPGHGTSIEPERTDIADYGDWLAGVVRALDRPVHLVGHSMGSFIALECARMVPVASVTLVGTAAAMPVHPALLDAAAANDPLAAQLMSGWAFAHHTRTGPNPSPGSSMVGTTQAMIGQAKPGVLHHDLAMCASYNDAVSAASEITAPTLLLLGALDRMTPAPKAQPLLDALTNGRVQVEPGVGHMVQIEAPEATRATIAASVS